MARRTTYRRARRRPRQTRRTYTLAHLLEKQPKTMRRQPGYDEMIARFNASERLQSLRVSSRCYTLLNQARIAPHNLENFYRTYRLPADPFFALFFLVKRGYLAEREQIREERRQYILSAMRSLPPDTLAQIKYLGHLERHYNAAGRSPLWQSEVFPGSKKKADSYRRFTPVRWHALFRSQTVRLMKRYPAFTRDAAERVLACFVLGLVPEGIPPAMPAAPEVIRTYRRLSLEHHPDRGGDPELFISIKRARDVLVGAG